MEETLRPPPAIAAGHSSESAAPVLIGESYGSFLDGVVRFGAIAVAAIGSTVLIGWILGIDILTRVLPGLVTMKPNTAIAFVTAGASLWFLRDSAPGAKLWLTARALAAFIVVLACLTLSQDLFGAQFGIDQLVIRADSIAGDSHPGRMAPATAISFIFAGLALLTLRGRRYRLMPAAHWLAIPTLFIATLALVGYAYGVTSLYKVGPFTSMAVHTGLAFFILALAILAADHPRGVAGIMSSDTDGGVVARWLLPTIPPILFILGWARLAGQEAGLYDTRFGLALMVLISITVSATIILFTAVKLHGLDRRRRRAEREIIALNLSLERRVEERTRELEESLAQVRQLGGLLPICAWCKNVRDDQHYWQSVEQYVSERTDARFSHGICPTCLAKVEAST